MEKIIVSLVKPLISEQSKFTITKEFIDSKIVYNLNVAEDDMGKVIGKNGRIAQAIRTILYETAKNKNENIRINFHAV